MYSHSEAQIHALTALFRRYQEKSCEHQSLLDDLPKRCQASALIALCEEAITHMNQYPFDKLNRWLGFVQGVLAVTGAIDVDEERDFSRPLLHSFHGKTPPSFAT